MFVVLSVFGVVVDAVVDGVVVGLRAFVVLCVFVVVVGCGCCVVSMCCCW